MATLTSKRICVLWASWLILALIVSNSAALATANDPNKTQKESASSYRIRSVNWEQSAEDYILRIKGGSKPTYTMYELFEPLRVIIDIADASLEPSVTLPIELAQGPVTVVNGRVITDKKPSFTRIEIFLRADHSYTVDRTDNDILVKLPISVHQEQVTPVHVPAVVSNEKQSTSFRSEAEIDSVKDPQPSGIVSDRADGLLATKLVNIEVSKSPNETKIFLKTDGAVRNFKKVLLGKNSNANRPDRMYIDLNNIRLIGATETIAVGTSVSNVRTAKRQDGTRVVFDSGLDELFDYTINKLPDGLLIIINEPSATKGIISNLTSENKEISQNTQQLTDSVKSILATTAASDNTDVAEPVKPSLSTATSLEETDIAENETQVQKRLFKGPGPSDLTFAGYTKQRITVDFYKIDLHNVFRLFGEISNLNIVVDEGVGGSLTLALNDVPWDFALDIILNLKDLQKEERFNTIVISPKSKSFNWPERALDSVEFKSDIKIQQAEQADGGLKISKRLEVPESIVEAKKLIHQANIYERKGDFAAAITQYELAYSKWADNVSLAKRIAAICLVNLEQNAKAVHYARTAIRLSPGDNDAALQAAIGLARMQKTTEAKDFFEMSVTGDKPSSEALSSYSSFCEEQLDYNCSLTQLKRHEELHGDTVDTMVSKARIYDKLGKQDLATQEYRTILLSGYVLPPDLLRYIKGRASLADR